MARVNLLKLAMFDGVEELLESEPMFIGHRKSAQMQVKKEDYRKDNRRLESMKKRSSKQICISKKRHELERSQAKQLSAITRKEAAAEQDYVLAFDEKMAEMAK